MPTQNRSKFIFHKIIKLMNINKIEYTGKNKNVQNIA